MSSRRTVDVSRLPDITLDSGALFWWATAGLIAIEAMSFAIIIATFIYLRMTVTDWPPPTLPPPDLRWGIAGLVVLVISCVPIRMAEKIAGRGRPEEDRRRIAALIRVFLLIAAVAVAIRLLEFPGTHCKWNNSAYGSVIWTTLGIHLLEALAGFAEFAVVAAVLVGSHAEEKHLLDVRACALFWYFIVAVWIPLFGMIYVFPRLS
ncbi:MAG: cytochrome c oxidase subunit 3 [Acidobacteria bacterium]|nr:cytochrome c oxidase subunit 3 [Acidobacteriota bacterium]MCA1611581.1 cytochrome c oxidase subunit 3 [Acidobacteriota bacterium]